MSVLDPNFEAEKRRLELKRLCRVRILSKAPEEKQRNIGLGLLTAEEAEPILAHIRGCLVAYEAAKIELQAIVASEERLGLKVAKIRRLRLPL
ncbi:hypothetical protein [Paracoccus beibuensis]|uniref:hypothetical protein n=1 Tax=Paracoccus beibuensis TaxID=547602 RepID=UPI00223FD611|nr:hypothetical protein [Paracoccus beibuensis]